MKLQERVYVFLYSLKEQYFDTFLIESNKIESLKLRARFNTHRDLNVFAVKLTPQQVKTINTKLENKSELDIDVFNSIKYIINIGF